MLLCPFSQHHLQTNDSAGIRPCSSLPAPRPPRALSRAGTKGKRYAMPSTRIMLQQPNGGAMGSADEVNIQAAELNRTMKVCYK